MEYEWTAFWGAVILISLGVFLWSVWRELSSRFYTTDSSKEGMRIEIGGNCIPVIRGRFFGRTIIIIHGQSNQVTIRREMEIEERHSS